MRDVAIVSVAQSRNVTAFLGNEIEMLLPVVRDAIRGSGFTREQIGFSTLASSDFYAGQAFAFVRALDAMGAYPVVDDSHVDMDGAFALYEAWLRLQVGDVDTALVVALGRASTGKLAEIGKLALDPYYVAPLSVDPHSLAALQAQALIEGGHASVRLLHAITEKNLENAQANPFALEGYVSGAADTAFVARPLRARDCARVADGVVAMVLATRERAYEVCERPVFIAGIDQRIEAHALGQRDLTRVPSVRVAATSAGLEHAPIDLAELTCLYPHEEVLLTRELELSSRVTINPSGSAFAGHPVMATGLSAVAHAARAVLRGESRRALAHASSGACLQHNLVTILEARDG